MQKDTYPLVTIAIPTYQAEEFLAETLSTALSQTYPNIEILISDDGSTDGTLEIAKEFQKNSAVDFKILNHDRLGMVNNWNYCITMSQGKYIKFLFQDDLLASNCVDEMVKLAQEDDDIGLVFSPRVLILAEGAELDERCLLVYRDCSNLYQAWSNLQSVQWGRELLQDPNLLESPINKIGEPSTVMIKKEVFEEIGSFDPDLCQIVDVDMWLRIMGRYKIAFIDEKLSSFRLHTQQQTLSNMDSGEHLLDNDRFNRKILIAPCYGNFSQGNKEKIYNRIIANLEHKYNNLAREWCKDLENQLQLTQGELADNKLRQENKEKIYNQVMATVEDRYDSLAKAKIAEVEVWATNLENSLRATQQELENQLKLGQQDLDKTKIDLADAQGIIEGMESSKFWKIRGLWFKVKGLFAAEAKKPAIEKSSIS
jgi:glycosyltransferase involved in cell wall biosynthesis